MHAIDRRDFLGLAATAAALPFTAAATEAKPLRLGVIASGDDADGAISYVKDLGFTTCQIYFAAGGDGAARAWRAALAKYAIEPTSLIVTGPGPEVYDFLKGPSTIGLIPRAYRAARIARMKQASDFAKAVGIPGIQGHCGFMPEDPNDALFGEIVAALREVAGYCQANGQTFRCETGQETPVALARVLRAVALPNIGVNLDCANLILYGKANPVDALGILGQYVLGVHAKDGRYPTDPNQLGEETPIGQGQVDFPRFIAGLKAAGYRGPITIEREASGAWQRADILASKSYLEALIG
jgi:sugar phosphate isomerase/epimerase